MGITGLVNSIIYATANIDAGRKGFAIRGKEQEGRISYENGIDKAMLAFVEAQKSAAPQTIILAEYTFLSQELELCDKSDKDSLNSLSKALKFFDDAFLALKVVEDKNKYEGAENTYPHDKKYRVSGCPKDSFHIACLSHKARIKNILRFSGIDPIEKALLKQRLANLSTAQEAYVGKQNQITGNKIKEQIASSKEQS